MGAMNFAGRTDKRMAMYLRSAKNPRKEKKCILRHSAELHACSDSDQKWDVSSVEGGYSQKFIKACRGHKAHLPQGERAYVGCGGIKEVMRKERSHTGGCNGWIHH